MRSMTKHSDFNQHSGFKLVCANCEGVGVKLDFGEGAAPSTVVKCSICGAPRGTMGGLREFANSDRRDWSED
jgi:hypothetical protein